MTLVRSWCAHAGLALALLAGVGSVQARSDVQWSVGIGVPGVVVGVNSPQAYYAPPPVYYAPPAYRPPPVYYAPPTYRPPQVYYAPPPPVYYRPPPPPAYYAPPRPYHHHGHGYRGWEGRRDWR
ncbi:hypothetical protein MASR1M59_15610 [Melaminivora sp.]